MHSKTFILFTFFACLSCSGNISYSAGNGDIGRATVGDDTNPYRNIGEIPVPAGFTRIKTEDGSFAGWLLKIKLKKDKTVYKFDGTPKHNQAAQFAVLDVSVGEQDLQQCADAVIRLRAEYLFSVRKFRDIHFTDNAGTVYQFNEPYTRNNLLLYLQRVFGMCGSASLAKQLKPVSFNDIEAGDVIIRGGFPGHAVIVMDVAVNSDGIKRYLLAQSYMPAQDIHVLVNPANKLISPWYHVNNDELIVTPEYNFTTRELKRW